jgi:ABC-type antimicrobial peptide transport system permease subunit
MAGMGLYAMMSWVVAERGRELSIRMALGADSVRVLRLLLGQGMTLAFAGLAGGLLAAWLVRRWLPIAELPICAALSLAILALAFLACWFPARRAARIDPRVAFRLD